jgi:hypothetical protein
MDYFDVVKQCFPETAADSQKILGKVTLGAGLSRAKPKKRSGGRHAR